MKKNRSKTVKKVALPKLEDFSHEDMEEIYEFSKAFYNTTAFDAEVERELWPACMSSTTTTTNIPKEQGGHPRRLRCWT